MTTKKKCEGQVLVVMDYNQASVSTYKVHIPESEEDTTSWVEDYMDVLGHKASECEWMLGNGISFNLGH